MDIPWYAWIAIVGIIVWGVIAVLSNTVWGRSGKNDYLTKALEDNAATNKALLAKLETIDERLGKVEKTLTDIQ